MSSTQPPGPVKADIDLRTMLRSHLAVRAADAIKRGAARRRKAIESPQAFAAWQTNVRGAAEAMLDLGTDLDRTLQARVINTRSFAGFRLENVIFDSVSGWQVNASVFVPEHITGPCLPVIVPCGHSAKSAPAYQLVCQVLARAGYLAITFDAPRQGEKTEGNDHFIDGVRSAAVGQSSQRYFVADALAAINYLHTRHDVDQRSGFAITGVSGGAVTAMHAAVIDSRISVAGLVCGPVDMTRHPILDGYAICPEKLPIGRLASGVDDIDMMAAIAPRPLMFMAGRLDPIMPPAATEPVIKEVAAAYAAAGAARAFNGALVDTGHDYTPEMARRFVEFLDQHFALSPPRRGADYARQPQLLAPEAMHCHPAPAPNMRTLAADRAEQMRIRRPKLRSRRDAAEAVRELLGDIDGLPPAEAATSKRHRVWQADVQEVLLTHEGGIALPATLLYPRARDAADGVVVVFDDRGRWAPIEQNGWASQLAGVFDREAVVRHPIVMSVDLRGWGDTAPAATAFDVAGWAARDRWPNYVANALGDSLMAQRVRDGVAAARWMLETARLDDRRLAFAGRGLGGVLALMTACLFEHTFAVVTIDTPQSVQDILTQPTVNWDLSVFMPHLLDHADLYELADAFGPVYHVRPRSGANEPLNSRSDHDAANWLLQQLNKR